MGNQVTNFPSKYICTEPHSKQMTKSAVNSQRVGFHCQESPTAEIDQFTKTDVAQSGDDAGYRCQQD